MYCSLLFLRKNSREIPTCISTPIEDNKITWYENETETTPAFRFVLQAKDSEIADFMGSAYNRNTFFNIAKECISVLENAGVIAHFAKMANNSLSDVGFSGLYISPIMKTPIGEGEMCEDWKYYDFLAQFTQKQASERVRLSVDTNRLTDKIMLLDALAQ